MDSSGLLHSYLVAFAFFLTLILGALFFVLLQHLVRAGWSVVVRRLAEALAMNLPLLALLFLPLLFGLRALYPGPTPGSLAADPLTAAKQPYLNPPFFVVRWVVYFASGSGWPATSGPARSARRRTGDPRWTLQRERTSAPGMVLFAVTLQLRLRRSADVAGPALVQHDLRRLRLLRRRWSGSSPCSPSWRLSSSGRGGWVGP